MANILTAYAIFANGELQITEYDIVTVAQEVKDLQGMECDEIKVYKCVGGNAEMAIDEINDRFRDGKPYGRKGMADQLARLDVIVTPIGITALQVNAKLAKMYENLTDDQKKHLSDTFDETMKEFKKS